MMIMLKNMTIRSADDQVQLFNDIFSFWYDCLWKINQLVKNEWMAFVKSIGE